MFHKIIVLFIAFAIVHTNAFTTLKESEGEGKLILEGIEIPEVEALITATVATDLGKAGKAVVQYLKEMANAKSLSISQPYEGAVFMSSVDGTWGLWNGMVIGWYYHPTYSHQVSTTGKLGLKQSVAAGGNWAVSAQTKGIYGNKVQYKTFMPNYNETHIIEY